MNVITERSLILTVAKRWEETYSSGVYGSDKLDKLKLLNKMDVETATADDVAGIIGNRSWTRLTCDECKQDVSAVIEVGEEPDYESATAQLCFECISKASALAHNTSVSGER